MIVLIVLLIVGSGLVYISKANMTPVSLHVGPYMYPDIPLFYVILGAFIISLILSFIIHSFYDISYFFALRSKKNELAKNQDEILELTKRVHQLELEKEKIKHEAPVEMEDKNAL